MIAFLEGFKTKEEAEADLQKHGYKEKYTIASVMEKHKDYIAHFVIPIKAVDLLMTFDESAE